MNVPQIRVTWAPRVSREKILELYIKIASGNDDAKLIDEISNAFYNRCSDIIRIYERRFACPSCHNELTHPHPPGADLSCDSCGWRMEWKPFFHTFKGRQLSVNVDLTDITRKFAGGSDPVCPCVLSRSISRQNEAIASSRSAAVPIPTR